MTSYGVAPVTVVASGQEFTLVVTDASNAELAVYLDADLRTRVTQPYDCPGHASFTVYRPLAAATETVVVTALVQGEPTTTTVTLGPAGTTVTLSGAPGSALGNHPGLGTDGHLYPA